jgi:hypothetical protein
VLAVELDQRAQLLRRSHRTIQEGLLEREDGVVPVLRRFLASLLQRAHPTLGRVLTHRPGIRQLLMEDGMEACPLRLAMERRLADQALIEGEPGGAGSPAGNHGQ